MPLSFALQNKVYYPFSAKPLEAMHLKQSFKSIAFGYIIYKEGNALPSVIYYITEGNRSIASKFCSAKQKIISFAKAKPYIAKGDVKIDAFKALL